MTATELTAIAFIVFLGFLWAIQEFVWGVLLWRDRQKIKHQIRVERTMRDFANARNELMRMALANEIDIHSATFKILYVFNSCLMRRPDKYPEISVQLRHFFANQNNSTDNDSVFVESKTWSEGVKNVVIATADAMDSIIADYIWFGRLRLKYMWAKIYLDSQHSQKETDRVVSELRETQQEMYKLAAAH